MDVQTRIGMPMNEFIRQYDEAPFELIDGERILLPLQVAGQAAIVSFLAEAFFIYEQNMAKFEFLLHIPFIQVDEREWVIDLRTPKILVYETRRWLDYRSHETHWKEKPLLLAPDVCIEVLSPNDSTPDLPEKAARYLNDGVQLVWVFNSRQKFVTIHSKARSAQLNENDTLNGGDILPNFSLPIRALFAE